jgi:hypothetical protein
VGRIRMVLRRGDRGRRVFRAVDAGTETGSAARLAGG